MLGGAAVTYFVGNPDEQVAQLKLSLNMSEYAIKQLRMQAKAQEGHIAELSRVSAERQERAMYWNKIADKRKKKFEEIKAQEPEVEDWADTVQPDSLN